jgi:hexaprenyl-diphosphate synthase
LLVSKALSAGLMDDSSSAPSLSSAAPAVADLLLPTQRRLSEITEMIHTASLLHDDVIDESDTRRGLPSVNALYGNKIAILGGDFLLARASVALAHLRHPDVIILMSTVIEHLVKGEVMQMKAASTTGLKETIDYYLTKSFYKTASLIANSCKSVALLGGHGSELQQVAYDYGTHLGLAFQIVDDLLDLEASAAALGKPAGNDLVCGVATAPVLYAAEEFPHLKPLIAGKFKGPNDVQTAIECIFRGQAMQRSRELAWRHAQQAAAAIAVLKPSRSQSALFSLINQVLSRKK